MRIYKSGYCQRKQLNIRAEAGEDAKIVGKLPAEAGCEILDTKDGWYRIRSGKVSGYVRGDYIITGDQAREMAEKLKKTMATVNTLTVTGKTKYRLYDSYDCNDR